MRWNASYVGVTGPGRQSAPPNGSASYQHSSVLNLREMGAHADPGADDGEDTDLICCEQHRMCHKSGVRFSLLTSGPGDALKSVRFACALDRLEALTRIVVSCAPRRQRASGDCVSARWLAPFGCPRFTPAEDQSRLSKQCYGTRSCQAGRRAPFLEGGELVGVGSTRSQRSCAFV